MFILQHLHLFTAGEGCQPKGKRYVKECLLYYYPSTHSNLLIYLFTNVELALGHDIAKILLPGKYMHKNLKLKS